MDGGQKPRLNWAEGLDESELATGQRVVGESAGSNRIVAGHQRRCDSVRLFCVDVIQGRAPLVRLYMALCVRPLSLQQARDLGVIVDVTRRLAHSHVSAAQPIHALEVSEEKAGKTTLPGMIFGESVNERGGSYD